MRRWIGEAAVIATLSLAVAVAVFALGSRAPDAGPPAPVPPRASADLGCREAPVRQVAATGVSGQARVCLGDAGLSVTLTAEHLTIGDAYAVWLTYLDRDRPVAEESSGRNDPNRPSGLAERIDGGRAQDGQAVFTADVPGLRPSARSEIVVRLFAVQPSAAVAASVPPTAPDDRPGSLVALATFDLETAPPLPRAGEAVGRRRS